MYTKALYTCAIVPSALARWSPMELPSESVWRHWDIGFTTHFG